MMNIFNILILLLFFIFCSSDYPIRFDDECVVGQCIDGSIYLTAFKNHYYNVDFSSCLATTNYSYNLVYTLGANIETKEYSCDNKKTDGPTPVIFYNITGSSTQHCYWIGGLGECTMKEYVPDTQTFELNYPGAWSTENPRRMRSVRFHMKCKMGSDVKSTCLGITEFKSEIRFDIQVESRFSCPTGPGTQRFRRDEFYVALVFFVLCGTGWFVFIFCLSMIFLCFLFLIAVYSLAKRHLYQKLL